MENKLNRLKSIIQQSFEIWEDPKEFDYPNEYGLKLIDTKKEDNSITLVYEMDNDLIEIIIKV
jgi:hypothetical protein